MPHSLGKGDIGSAPPILVACHDTDHMAWSQNQEDKSHALMLSTVGGQQSAGEQQGWRVARLQLGFKGVPEVDLAVEGGGGQQLAAGRPRHRQHIVAVLQHLHAPLPAAHIQARIGEQALDRPSRLPVHTHWVHCLDQAGVRATSTRMEPPASAGSAVDFRNVLHDCGEVLRQNNRDVLRCAEGWVQSK